MKTCPFCKKSIDQSSEKCPVCRMTLIEKVPVIIKKTIPNAQPKQIPPEQKSYTYKKADSAPKTQKQPRRWRINILGSLAFFVVSSIILTLISSSHGNPTTVTSTAGTPSSMVPQVTQPATPPVSLPTGTVLYENQPFFNSYNGDGELTIKNGSGYDALVKLVYNGHSVYTVYVQKNDTYSIQHITDGTYTVAFAFGTNWDKANDTFLEDQSFQKFDDSFDFTTTSDTNDYIYSHYTISLNPVPDGTATTSTVNQSDFDSY